MQKIILIIIVLLSMIFNSCSLAGPHMTERLFDTDNDVANAHMDKILEALENGDKESIKAMFSENAIAVADDFDKSVDELFEYYEGEYTSYEDGGMSTENAYSDGEEQQIFDLSYDVTTSVREYRFSVLEYITDDADPDNEGIWSLYIIKMEDDPQPEYSYRGDGKRTPGIHIGLN